MPDARTRTMLMTMRRDEMQRGLLQIVLPLRPCPSRLAGRWLRGEGGVQDARPVHGPCDRTQYPRWRRGMTTRTRKSWLEKEVCVPCLRPVLSRLLARACRPPPPRRRAEPTHFLRRPWAPCDQHPHTASCREGRARCKLCPYRRVRCRGPQMPLAQGSDSPRSPSARPPPPPRPRPRPHRPWRQCFPPQHHRGREGGLRMSVRAQGPSHGAGRGSARRPAQTMKRDSTPRRGERSLRHVPLSQRRHDGAERTARSPRSRRRPRRGHRDSRAACPGQTGRPPTPACRPLLELPLRKEIGEVGETRRSTSTAPRLAHRELRG
jgi:hypothetical protein